MKENICYNCFSQLTGEGDSCPRCGYDPAGEAEKYPLALKPGSILNGRYIIGRVLGQGGFGITYVAQDDQTGDRVAIKEFFPETMATRTGTHSVAAFTGQRAENFTYGMQCFLSEAQTLAQFIGTEHIVRVHSYFEENGTAYFVMDYVDGVSFQTYLKQRGGKISWEEAKTILVPVMDALSTVHGKGIIHRDIAPDNIYITYDGTVKLLDFGAARYSLGDRSRSLDVVLKAGYAPMEQYTRRGRQGAYTDVYAMAATFYYALTGHLPPEAVERMEEDMLVLPSSYGARIPAEAEDAIEKGLAVRATERWQTMEEFRQVMTADGYISGTKIIPERPRFQKAQEPVKVVSDPVKQTSGTVTFEQKKEPVKPEPPKPAGDKKTIFAVVGAVLLLLLGISLSSPILIALPVGFLTRIIVSRKKGNNGQKRKQEKPKFAFSKKQLIAAGAAALVLVVSIALIPGDDEDKGSKPKNNSSASSSKTQDDQEEPASKFTNRVWKTTEYNADNTIKSIKLNDFTYNSQGRTISIVGKVTGEESYITKVEFGYDDQGNQTMYKYHKDNEFVMMYTYSDFVDGRYYTKHSTTPDGNNDYVSKYTYDSNGYMIKETSTADTYNYIYEYTNDADGNQLTSHYEFHYKGELSSYRDTVYTYDSRGDRISSEVKSYDQYGNLEKTERSTYAYVYDNEDHLLRQTETREDGTYTVNEYEWVEIPLGVESPAETEAPRILWDHAIHPIAVGLNHSLALKKDGTVAAAGYNNDGDTLVSGWENIVSLSSSGAVTVGLKSDGTVLAAGENDMGQCDVSGWTDIIQVSTSGDHTVGLRSDGTVVATGKNEKGECSKISKWTDIVAIATGYGRTDGLKADGTVVTTGTSVDVSGWKNVVQLSSGKFHVVALRADGEVLISGNNKYGQCDIGKWKNIVAVAAGDYATFGIKSDGSVVAVGQNDKGQCDVSDWTDIVAIAAGRFHAIGLRADGTVVVAGDGSLGRGNVTGWTDIVLPKDWQ